MENPEFGATRKVRMGIGNSASLSLEYMETKSLLGLAVTIVGCKTVQLGDLNARNGRNKVHINIPERPRSFQIQA